MSNLLNLRYKLKTSNLTKFESFVEVGTHARATSSLPGAAW